MEQPTCKVCPKCGQTAFLDSPYCVRCGHQYQAQFVPPQAPHSLPAPSTKLSKYSKLPKRTRLVIGCCSIWLLFSLIGTVITASEKRGIDLHSTSPDVTSRGRYDYTATDGIHERGDTAIVDSDYHVPGPQSRASYDALSITDTQETGRSKLGLPSRTRNNADNARDYYYYDDGIVSVMYFQGHAATISLVGPPVSSYDTETFPPPGTRLMPDGGLK